MYLKATARILVNVHDLNNEASIGTFTDIRKVKVMDSQQTIHEVVAVSGNMLKHHHFVYTKSLLEGRDGFCYYCARNESWRLPQKDERLAEIIKAKGDREKIFAKAEEKLLTTCAIEDIHGFLSPSQALSIKRESRVRFSWFVPVEDSEGEALTTAVHNRVAKVTGAEQEVKQQMFFYKQYASGIYSFSTSMDLGRIGKSDYNNAKVKALADEKIDGRRRATLEALVPMLGSEIGASMSRALPIVKPLEILIAASEYAGLPNLVSGFYKDYRSTNIRLINSIAQLTEQKIYLFVSPKLDSGSQLSDKVQVYEEPTPVDAVRRAVEVLLH